MSRKYEGWEIVVDNIRRIMHEQRMTQAELSQRSGVGPSAISLILSGSNFRMSTLLVLAKALGVEPWTLLIRPDDKPPANGTHPSSSTDDIAKALSLLISLAKGAK